MATKLSNTFIFIIRLIVITILLLAGYVTYKYKMAYSTSIYIANPLTTTVFNENYVKTAYEVYFKGGSVDADPDSFKAISNHYAYDKNALYYDGDKTDETIINRKKFVVIDDVYAKDDQFVYFQGERLENANPNTIKILDNSFAFDNLSVYFRAKRLEYANPKTIRIVDAFFALDDENLFYHGRKVEGRKPDKETFKHLKDNYYTDKNDLYKRHYDNVQYVGCYRPRISPNCWSLEKLMERSQ